MKFSKPNRSILIINPNTTESMTDALRPLVDALAFHETNFSYFTAPSGVASIDGEDDAAVSTEACLPTLLERLSNYDGFLVCCYSQHPLVARLREELTLAGLSGRMVTGIFEASIAACMQSINVDSKFGIVSTGMQWEGILQDAVLNLLGSTQSSRYVGTETTGLNARELHFTSKEEVDRRMKEATKQALRKGAQSICLGCAGMSGMAETVREACIEFFGAADGVNIKIIDGVVCGVVFLEGALRAGL